MTAGVNNRVREYREKLGLNQTELAENCKVSRQTIHAIEKGLINPSVILALRIAHVLKTTVEKLFAISWESK